MRAPREIWLLAGALALGGCVPPECLHPICGPEGRVEEPLIEGVWKVEGEKDDYYIIRKPEKGIYSLLSVNERDPQPMRLALAKVGPYLVADVSPDLGHGDVGTVHLFFRVECSGDALRFVPVVDRDELRFEIEEGKAKVPHEKLKERGANAYLLTASSEELQKLVVAWAKASPPEERSWTRCIRMVESGTKGKPK